MFEVGDGKTVLVLAPHTDDGESGCGGSIRKFIKQGCRVIYIAFSAAEESVLDHLPRDILRTEVKAAVTSLGLCPEDLHILNFPVRYFPENRQAILESMVELEKKFKPDIVFLPSANDTHQDHQTIATEGFRAFKRHTMLGYEVPWNNLNFSTGCFIEITQDELESKISAMECYKSQSHRAYARGSFLTSLATVRGVQIGKKFAETFEVIRWIVD